MWASRIGFVVGTVGGQRGISVPEVVPHCTHWYLSVVKEEKGRDKRRRWKREKKKEKAEGWIGKGTQELGERVVREGYNDSNG